jgi:hypothetical protein
VDVKNCYVWLPEVYWVEGKIYGKRYCDPIYRKIEATTNVFPPTKDVFPPAKND